MSRFNDSDQDLFACLNFGDDLDYVNNLDYHEDNGMNPYDPDFEDYMNNPVYENEESMRESLYAELDAIFGSKRN